MRVRWIENYEAYKVVKERGKKKSSGKDHQSRSATVLSGSVGTVFASELVLPLPRATAPRPFSHWFLWWIRSWGHNFSRNHAAADIFKGIDDNGLRFKDALHLLVLRLRFRLLGPFPSRCRVGFSEWGLLWGCRPVLSPSQLLGLPSGCSVLSTNG